MTTMSYFGDCTRPSIFSFYVTESAIQRGQGLALARTAARLAGALTIAGPAGPGMIHRLRALEVDVPVFFDGLGYTGKELPPPEEWIRTQRQVGGATEAFLPGVFVHWDASSNAGLVATIRAQGRIAADTEASLLIALDARCLAKQTDFLVDELRAVNRPVALVLANNGDPLSLSGAVSGLRRLASQVDDLSLLRTDHGGIGALSFGAKHASVGLTTTTRHYAPTFFNPRKDNEPSQRLFVAELMDWFKARDVAAWAAAGLVFSCDLPCCRSSRLDRFFDPDNDATLHNMSVLADLASRVLNANTDEAHAYFISRCLTAIQNYGLGIVQGLKKPKRQLTSWAFS